MRVLYQIRFSSAEQQELHHNEDFPELMCWAVAETLPTADGSRMRFGQGASWMGDTGPGCQDATHHDGSRMCFGQGASWMEDTGPGIDTLRPPRQVLQTLPEPTQRVLTGQGKSGKGQHVAPGDCPGMETAGRRWWAGPGPSPPLLHEPLSYPSLPLPARPGPVARAGRTAQSKRGAEGQ